MTEEILNIMDERRKYRGKNETTYKQIHKNIRIKIQQAKETWLSERCQEIEELEQRHDTFNLHKKVKEAAGIFKQTPTSFIEDKHDNPLLNIEDQIGRWREYVEEMFQDRERTNIYMQEASTESYITKQQIIKAANQIKNRKAVGEDNIPIEVIKILLDEHIEVMEDIFNKIYETGIIPNDWLTSVFITLPKKRKLQEM
ncbi:unnamed protein product [Diabrotica balteata]|uniref:Uncharacterized protein n=1 Tax=Diabrotica balteata TaxID=107213 RepID=A0A9N9XG36_DIABA|nr:unnamed protein product [Diabrotica balteata]